MSKLIVSGPTVKRSFFPFSKRIRGIGAGQGYPGLSRPEVLCASVPVPSCAPDTGRPRPLLRSPGPSPPRRAARIAPRPGARPPAPGSLGPERPSRPGHPAGHLAKPPILTSPPGSVRRAHCPPHTDNRKDEKVRGKLSGKGQAGGRPIAPHFLQPHPSARSSGPPTQLPGLITGSDSPSSPLRDTRTTGWGLGSAPSSAATLPPPGMLQRRRSHRAGRGANARVDLGNLQKPPSSPVRSEHRSDALPTRICEANPRRLRLQLT